MCCLAPGWGCNFTPYRKNEKPSYTIRHCKSGGGCLGDTARCQGWPLVRWFVKVTPHARCSSHGWFGSESPVEYAEGQKKLPIKVINGIPCASTAEWGKSIKQVGMSPVLSGDLDGMDAIANCSIAIHLSDDVGLGNLPHFKSPSDDATEPYLMMGNGIDTLKSIMMEVFDASCSGLLDLGVLLVLGGFNLEGNIHQTQPGDRSALLTHDEKGIPDARIKIRHRRDLSEVQKDAAVVASTSVKEAFVKVKVHFEQLSIRGAFDSSIQHRAGEQPRPKMLARRAGEHLRTHGNAGQAPYMPVR